MKAALREYRRSSRGDTDGAILELNEEPVTLAHLREHFWKKLPKGQHFEEMSTPTRSEAPTPTGLREVPFAIPHSVSPENCSPIAETPCFQAFKNCDALDFKATSGYDRGMLFIRINEVMDSWIDRETFLLFPDTCFCPSRDTSRNSEWRPRQIGSASRWSRDSPGFNAPRYTSSYSDTEVLATRALAGFQRFFLSLMKPLDWIAIPSTTLEGIHMDFLHSWRAIEAVVKKLDGVAVTSSLKELLRMICEIERLLPVRDGLFAGFGEEAFNVYVKVEQTPASTGSHGLRLTMYHNCPALGAFDPSLVVGRSSYWA